MFANWKYEKFLAYQPDTVKNDKKIVIEAVKRNVWDFHNADERLKNDKEVICGALLSNIKLLPFISNRITDEIIPYLIENKVHCNILKYASDKIKSDKRLMTIAIQKDAHAIAYAINPDYSMKLEVVKQNGFLIHFIIDPSHSVMRSLGKNLIEFKPNKQERHLIEVAMKTYEGAILFLYPFQENIELIKRAFKFFNGDILKHIPENLLANFEFIKYIICENGLALKFASETLRDNKELALLAIEKDADAYQFISERLKDDHQVVTHAFKYYKPPFNYEFDYCIISDLPDRYLNELILFTLEHCIDFLNYINPFKNKNVLRLAAKENCFSSYYLCKIEDRENILDLIEEFPILYYHLGPLRQDKELVTLAVKNDGLLCKFLKEKEFTLELAFLAAKNNGQSIKFMPKKFTKNYDIVYTAIQTYPEAIRYGARTFRSNTRMIRRVVEQDGLLLRFASKRLRNDEETFAIAYGQNKNAKLFMGEELKQYYIIKFIYNPHIYKYAEILSG